MPELHLQQEKALELVKDWSTWSAGLNFASGAGCILMLQQGVSQVVRIYLVSGVLFFTTSLLITSLIFLALPSIMQQLPVTHKTKNPVGIYDYELTNSITLKHLIGSQFVLFLLGLVSLFMWVMLKK